METISYGLSHYNRFILDPLDNTVGSLHLSDAPGLGIEMNVDFLEANLVEDFRPQIR